MPLANYSNRLFLRAFTNYLKAKPLARCLSVGEISFDDTYSTREVYIIQSRFTTSATGLSIDLLGSINKQRWFYTTESIVYRLKVAHIEEYEEYVDYVNMRFAIRYKRDADGAKYEHIELTLRRDDTIVLLSGHE